MADRDAKDLTSNIKKLALFNFFIEFKFYSPILVIMLVNYTGKYVQAMSILAVMSLSVVIMEFPTGLLSDAIGRKKTMIAGVYCLNTQYTYYYCNSSHTIPPESLINIPGISL